MFLSFPANLLGEGILFDPITGPPPMSAYPAPDMPFDIQEDNFQKDVVYQKNSKPNYKKERKDIRLNFRGLKKR
jgi:hypothetical protein